MKDEETKLGREGTRVDSAGLKQRNGWSMDHREGSWTRQVEREPDGTQNGWSMDQTDGSWTRWSMDQINGSWTR